MSSTARRVRGPDQRLHICACMHTESTTILVFCVCALQPSQTFNHTLQTHGTQTYTALSPIPSVSFFSANHRLIIYPMDRYRGFANTLSPQQTAPGVGSRSHIDRCRDAGTRKRKPNSSESIVVDDASHPKTPNQPNTLGAKSIATGAQFAAPKHTHLLYHRISDTKTTW